jgi:hypothetical protein
MCSDDEKEFRWETSRLVDDIVNSGELGRETGDNSVEESGLGGVEGHLDAQTSATLCLYKYQIYPLGLSETSGDMRPDLAGSCPSLIRFVCSLFSGSDKLPCPRPALPVVLAFLVPLTLKPYLTNIFLVHTLFLFTFRESFFSLNDVRLHMLVVNLDPILNIYCFLFTIVLWFFRPTAILPIAPLMTASSDYVAVPDALRLAWLLPWFVR